FYLTLLGEKASERVRSAAVPYVRPISSGQQSFGTTPSEYPLTKPMTKTTAKLQASGEAQYTDDILKQGGELYAAFVTTTQGNCKLANVDVSEVLKIPGVFKYICAEDIPGENNFVAGCAMFNVTKEKIFCDGDVDYAGQAVGLIVA
ncbi:Xanthine dehydrogenase, partial [Paramuricea clavata]